MKILNHALKYAAQGIALGIFLVFLSNSGVVPVVTEAPAPIAYTGSPMLGSGPVTIYGQAAVANEMIIIQQSPPFPPGSRWTNAAAAVSDDSGKYEVPVHAPPPFGTVWYRANFTGYILNSTMTETAIQGITPDQINEYISTGQYSERQMLRASVTDPIVVSSKATDSTIVGSIVAIFVLVGAAVWFSRRKRATPSKT